MSHNAKQVAIPPLDRNLPYLSHKASDLLVSSHLLPISFASQQYVNMLFEREINYKLAQY